MGKPSIKSRKNARLRQKNRQSRKKLRSEEEISDLQIQLQEYRKAGEVVIERVKRACKENDSLLKCINTYKNQIEIQQNRIYALELKLYQLSQSSQSSQSSPSTSSSSPQSSSLQLSSQQPQFKSMDEYFKWEREHNQ